MKSIYLISGASGVGKTSLIPHLKSMLSEDFEVHDFDERGVPNKGGHTWRLDETKYWLKLGQEKTDENITVVVCGFFNPDEIEKIKEDFHNIEIKIILLDGDAELIEKRLRDRNADSAVKAGLGQAVGSVEDFITNNTQFVPTLREICQKHNCLIIDTSNLDPKAVAEKVVELIKI